MKLIQINTTFFDHARDLSASLPTTAQNCGNIGSDQRRPKVSHQPEKVRQLVFGMLGIISGDNLPKHQVIAGAYYIALPEKDLK